MPIVRSNFRLLRHFAWASLIGILVAAGLLALAYRQVALNGIAAAAQSSNVALANAVLNGVRGELSRYLVALGDARAGGTRPPALDARTSDAIVDMMGGGAVVRVKVYDRQGTVAHATDPTLIGRRQHDNPGFLAALQGKVASSVILRGEFNEFDKSRESGNLVQSYLPVSAGPGERVVGVFEIYADLDPLLAAQRQSAFLSIAVAGAVLLALYAALLLVVRRAGRVIEEQQRTIGGRGETLEKLSAQMLAGEEARKKQLAEALHEGLAQTLTAIKLALEQDRRGIEPGSGRLDVVPLLQAAIKEVCAIAAELHPATLEILGLKATIRAYCGSFEQVHPLVGVAVNVTVADENVPPPLRIVIYRTIDAALKNIASQEDGPRLVHVSLSEREDAIALAIDDAPARQLAAGEPAAAERFGEAQGRAALSGGDFEAVLNRAGGATLHASWPLWNS